MAAVKLITSTPVSIDIPGSPPPLWSMTATKRHKKSFGQNPTFPLCCRLIDVLEDQKIYRTVHSRQGDTLILPEEMFEESESEN